MSIWRMRRVTKTMPVQIDALLQLQYTPRSAGADVATFSSNARSRGAECGASGISHLCSADALSRPQLTGTGQSSTAQLTIASTRFCVSVLLKTFNSIEPYTGSFFGCTASRAVSRAALAAAAFHARSAQRYRWVGPRHRPKGGAGDSHGQGAREPMVAQ